MAIHTGSKEELVKIFKEYLENVVANNLPALEDTPAETYMREHVELTGDEYWQLLKLVNSGAISFHSDLGNTDDLAETWADSLHPGFDLDNIGPYMPIENMVDATDYHYYLNGQNIYDRNQVLEILAEAQS